MICLNTKGLKDGMDIQNNVLYRIDGNKTVSIREEHGDCADVETVSLKFLLEDGQYAVFGKEYHSPNFSKHGCKSTDILTCLIDEKGKELYTFSLDIKKNISAFSDNLLQDNAVLSAVKEVSGFVEQLHHSILHKESFLVAYKSDGYKETVEVGIATRRFEKEKFLKVAEFLEDFEMPSNMSPLVWYKLKNNLMPYVGEVSKLRDFANQKVMICGHLYPLHVYLLEWSKGTEYTVTIELRME